MTPSFKKFTPDYVKVFAFAMDIRLGLLQATVVVYP